MHSHLKFCIEELWTNNFYSFFFKAAFELAVNDFRKSFSVKLACLAATENRISGKWFQFDRNFTPLTQKWFYTFILPSNHFRVTRRREREREKERERDSTEERSHQHPAPAKARSIHIQELRRTQKTQDWDRSSSNAPIIKSWTHSSDRRAHPLNPFLRSSSSFVEPIPQIVELVRRTHSSDHEPKSSPRDRPAESPIYLLWVNPPLGRSRRRSACSLIFGLISDWMNFFLLGIENLGFDEFGFCWSWWYICLEAEKMQENVRNMIKLGFLEYFQEYNQTLENILECNQTLENIFLSWK